MSRAGGHARYDEPDDGAWRRQAACRAPGMTDVMYPLHREGTEAGDAEWAAARAVCHGCPSRTPCLVYAVVTNQREGCWGGMSEQERRGIRRQAVRRAS